MNRKFNLALALAMDAHGEQNRKGTNNNLGIAIPYITHPIAVSALVIRYGGDEDQVVAGLLHDKLEDGRTEVDWISGIKVFGDRVLKIVEGCTDGKPDIKTGLKAPWKDRKEHYLAHLREADSDVLIVSSCDKLHNLQAINLDLVETGISVFDWFSAKRDDVLWYYRTLCEIFIEKGVAPAKALNNEYQSVEAKVKELMH